MSEVPQTTQYDFSRIPALVKAAWAVAVALAGVAGAIFYAGTHWADFTSKLDKIDAISKRLDAYQTIEGTRKVNADHVHPATCPPGYVVTAVTEYQERTEVACGKL
jgi:hypothetical protein